MRNVSVLFTRLVNEEALVTVLRRAFAAASWCECRVIRIKREGAIDFPLLNVVVYEYAPCAHTVGDATRDAGTVSEEHILPTEDPQARINCGDDQRVASGALQTRQHTHGSIKMRILIRSKIPVYGSGLAEEPRWRGSIKSQLNELCFQRTF